MATTVVTKMLYTGTMACICSKKCGFEPKNAITAIQEHKNVILLSLKWQSVQVYLDYVSF